MWQYGKKQIKSLKDIPKDVIGFIYEIEDENGKRYIGRKSLFSITNQEVSESIYRKAKDNGDKVKKTKNKAASVKQKSVVWRYKKEAVKETNWLTYNGSCKPLNDAIKKGLKITKRIVRFCTKAKEMTYYETKYQICEGVIEDNERFWNENVLAKFFPRDLN